MSHTENRGAERSALRWAIVGTGNIAQHFARELSAGRAGRVVAVCSRSAQAAAAFGAATDLDCAPFHDLSAMLANPDIDAVYVATPHHRHLEDSRAALAAGLPVLCEKPMGLNHAQVLALIDSAQQARRLLAEAFMYRLHPQTEQVLALVRDGAIGELRQVQASFGFQVPVMPDHRLFDPELGGGAILDIGCYPADFARRLFAAEPDSVHGSAARVSTGVDGFAAAQLRFGDAVAQISCATTTVLDNSVIVRGTEGHIEVPRPWHPNDKQGHWQFELRRNGKDPETVRGEDTLGQFAREAVAVAGALDAGQQEVPGLSWQDSLATAALLDRWRQSAGLRYPAEQRVPARLAPLPGSAAAPRIEARPVECLSAPLSRLVLGCDNQTNSTHAALMWDSYTDLGGSTFDTAHIYGGGVPETLLGQWLQSRGVRDQVTLIGKGAHTPHDQPRYVARQLSESLDRLQSGHIDLYCLHRDDPSVPVGEWLDALNDELAAGRVHALGASNWSLDRLRSANEWAAANGKRGFSAVSNNFALAEMIDPVWPGCVSARQPEYEQYLREQGLVLLPWSAQARGFFTPWAEAVRAASAARTAATTAEPTADELRRCWFSEANFARRARAEQFARERGVSLIEVALAWVLAQPFPVHALIGARTPAELRSSATALGLELTAQDVAWLDRG